MASEQNNESSKDLAGAVECAEMPDLKPFGWYTFLRVRDVADRLAMSDSRVYELVNSGELKSVETPAGKRIRESDLREYQDRLE